MFKSLGLYLFIHGDEPLEHIAQVSNAHKLYTCIFTCIFAFASGAGIDIVIRWVTHFEVSPQTRKASALCLKNSSEVIGLVQMI